MKQLLKKENKTKMVFVLKRTKKFFLKTTTFQNYCFE